MAQMGDAVGTSSVLILQGRYEPPVIRVAAGDIVRWRNDDAEAHTVSSAEIESGEIAPGEGFSYTFARPGHYRYFCMLHPRTVGEVFVR